MSDSELLVDIELENDYICFLVEFVTSTNDYTHVVFQHEPSDKEIIEYIESNDWLYEEYHNDEYNEGLTWIVTEVPLLINN